MWFLLLRLLQVCLVVRSDSSHNEANRVSAGMHFVDDFTFNSQGNNRLKFLLFYDGRFYL
jgi:hypothetical protein